ncbi:alpha-ketoacid dehydrogenase subunit beta [Lactiplantibacillus plantarum]|uniref:alpha-ketoacid dehydrogenase subunit beta n=1 Tax=Lactiplantibacillus plantarum TaxID=1590 RepID=UPI003F53AC3E
MSKKTYIQAITDALRLELGSDEKTLVFGEDVGENGGVFRATDGLQAEFGEDRVFDTPLAESGIGGLSIGLALEGFRPIPEIQFLGFIFETLDSIAGQMSRERFRTGGTRHMPITIRSPYGGGTHTPEMHADSLEGYLAQIPGLRVVTPSNPYDAKGLLISSIRNNDPVFFLENLKLYRSMKADIPDEAYTVPLDKANVVREGTDISLIAYSAQVNQSLKVAEKLEKEGISVEVVDLRTLSPLDEETILKSVQKTGRAVAIQEAQRQAGIAANVASLIAEKGALYLSAPVGRVYAPDTVYPFGLAEDDWLPAEDEIEAKTREILNY